MLLRCFKHFHLLPACVCKTSAHVCVYHSVDMVWGQVRGKVGVYCEAGEEVLVGFALLWDKLSCSFEAGATGYDMWDYNSFGFCLL